MPAGSTEDSQPNVRANNPVGVPENGEQLHWRRASRCATHGSCVEIAHVPGGGMAIRDGKRENDSPVLLFGQEEWQNFTSAIKSGELS